MGSATSSLKDEQNNFAEQQQQSLGDLSGASSSEVVGPQGDRHLVVHFPPGGQGAIVAESGAMVWCDSGLSISAAAYGGITKALLRSLAGESIFMNRFVNENGGGAPLSAAFAPDWPCDIVEVVVPAGQTYRAAAGALLAAEQGIQISGSLSLKMGLFGQGDLMCTTVKGHVNEDLRIWIASNGIAEQHDLARGQQLVVDNHRVLLSTGGGSSEIIKVGSIKTAVLGGEGLAMRFTGPCTVWTQTRRSLKHLVEKIAAEQNSGGDRGGFKLSLSGGRRGFSSSSSSSKSSAQKAKSTKNIQRAKALKKC